MVATTGKESHVSGKLIKTSKKILTNMVPEKKKYNGENKKIKIKCDEVEILNKINSKIKK